jgi:hypothetical protein
MNKVTKLLLLSVLFLFGCEQGGVDIITAPTEPLHNLKLISLPTSLAVQEIHTEYKWINGDDGGWFGEQFTYDGGPLGNVTIYSTLHFPQYAFSGWKNISQSFDTETASIVFGPSMQFNVPAEYTLTIYGVDLNGVDPNTLTFVYIDSNGNMYPCDYEYVTMDVNTGMLKVKDAELNHFSRYGFVN